MTASTILNNGSGGTISTTRRRRRRSSLEMATAAVLAVAAVALTSTSGSGGGAVVAVAATDQFGQPTARPPSRPRNPNLLSTTTTMQEEDDDSHHQHQQQQEDDGEESHQSQFQQSRHAQQESQSQFSRERHLATTSAATFAHYTSARITNAIPFDLKLDRSTGQGYVVVGRRQDDTGGGSGTTDGIMMEAMTSEQVGRNDNDNDDNGNDGDGDGKKKKGVVVDGNYYLEQYGQAVEFATNYNPNTRSSVSNVGNDGTGDSNGENAIVSLSQIMPSDEEVHHQSKHTKAQVFQELMEEVIAEEKEWVATNKEEGRNNNKGLRGRRLDNIGNNQKEEEESDESREEEGVKKLILNLNYIHFQQSKSSSDNNDHAAADDDGHDEQEDDEYDGEEEGDDEDLEGDEDFEEDLEGDEDDEENFHDAQQEQDEETITITTNTKRFLQGLPQDNHPSSTTNNNNNNMTTKAKSKNKNKNKNKNRKNVKIKSLTPDKGSIISSQQTFTAKIKTFNTNKSRVESVQFQLTDPTGSSSDWLNVPPKNEKNDLFQITVDGFQKYKGTRWTYKMKAKDTKGNVVTSNDILVKVDGVGGSANDFSNGGGGGGNTNTNDKDENVWQAPPAPSSNSNSQKLKSNIQDSNWPYGGSIQSATGRILFEFTNTGTYVCSGTVINDGSNTNGRSIIVTAAHCAYSDTMKQFAKKAVFIPDQVSTRGNKSDWDCGNDRYGCWALSFGVVEKGWASNSFPANVQVCYHIVLCTYCLFVCLFV